jgi:IS30 family transposase
MSYKHLSPEERYYLEIEKKSSKSSNTIASALGRSQTTISRELKRNTGKRGYRHQQATRLAQERHRES